MASNGKSLSEKERMESKKQRDKSQRTNLIETPATKKSLFGAPVKIERDDSVKARINNSLCSHDTFMKTFETKNNNPHSLYGVNSQPSTPVTTATLKFPGRDSIKTHTSTPKHPKERKNKFKHLALPTTNELVNNDAEKNKKVQEIIKEMTLVTPLSSIEPASKFAFPVKNSIQTKVQQNSTDQEKIQGHATNSNNTRSEQQKSHGNSNLLSDSSDNEDNDDKEECPKKSDINSNNLKENDDTRPPMKPNTSDESSSSSSSSSDSEASSSDDEKRIVTPQADIDPMLHQPAPVTQDTWKIADFIGNIPNVSNSQEPSTTNGKKKTDQSDNYPYGPVQPVRQAKKKAVYTSSGSDDSGDEDFEPAPSHSPSSKRQPNRKRKQPINKKSPTKSKITKPFKPVPSTDSDSSYEDISNGPNILDEKSEETKPSIQPYYNSNSQKRKPMAVITPLNSTTPSNPNSITEMPTNNPNINSGVTPVGASHGRHSIVVSLSLEFLRSVGVPIPRSNNAIPPTPSRERKRKKSPNETKDRGEKRIKKEPVEQSASSSTHNPDYFMQAAKECKREADNVKNDNWRKSTKYMEAVLHFLEWAQAKERSSDPKTIFTNYRETLPLVKKINSFDGQDITKCSERERKLYVLNLRIQSILCFKLFTFRRGDAKRLKRYIDEHSSPKGPTPSPKTPGSVTPGGATPSPQPVPTSGTVSVPANLHQITQNYMSDVSYLFEAHEFWNHADYRAKPYQEFFTKLDSKCKKPLSIHSSIEELVSYMRIGLTDLANS